MAGVLETVQEEDCVRYFLFPKEVNGVNANEGVEQVLERISSQIYNIVYKYSRDYIWQKDGFNITPKVVANTPLSVDFDNADSLPSHLYGVSHFGDNIEDEWFLVYLLWQLTLEIDGLIVRVIDSDGEFLLIEAAEFLPSWATPETCERRVYLYKGAVHIIPPSQLNVDKIPSLTVEEALEQIHRDPKHTEANQAIQRTIQERIKGYPGKITELLHRATAYVPVAVAALLKAKPSLIAPAVLAFCNRDPIDMKACRAMRYFPPENRVLTCVTFTKCLYAMITHHKYIPDRRTGWNMPPVNSPDFKAHNLGVKLACGFEILVAQAKPKPKDDNSPTEADFSCEPGWCKYLTSLKKKGYFQDFLEGSKDYNSLLEKAKEYYLGHRYSIQHEPSVGQEVLSLLSSLEYDLEELKKTQEDIPAPDDESWLELCPRDLDMMLEQRYGKRQFTTVSSSSDSTNISAHLAKFLDHISGVEGAEYPSPDESLNKDTPPVRPKRGIKLHKGKSSISDVVRHSDDESVSTSGNKIHFDPEYFTCAVQNILDFVVPEDSWDLESDGSDMSSYEDEVDMDLDQLKQGKGKKSKEPESELKQYMDQMDRELASSTLGKSFEKIHSSKTKDEKEVAGGKPMEEDSFDDIENFKPVDIDMNALKNIMASYQAQMGEAGPASNLLGPMGVRLDPDPSSIESTES
ncbi:protein ecdysoneless [Anabrus simplex]|uniref:protein ecdysoneless n=1 Tax=Anabrus simplex TaxID=316456 RepID=UPI0035A35E07